MMRDDAVYAAEHTVLQPTESILVSGGDQRIALEKNSIKNKYGCRPFPQPSLIAFGSCTASVVSTAGFDAADALRERLLSTTIASFADSCCNEMQRIRKTFLSLCDLNDVPGLEAIFAASGTDLHLIAAQLVAGMPASCEQPLSIVMMDANETGSSVTNALAGRHFSVISATGALCVETAAIHDAYPVDVETIALRLKNGDLRHPGIIDGEIEKIVSAAAQNGRHVLIVALDCSKTGLIAPDISCIVKMRHRFPDTVHVLIDACQFRIGSAALRAYLRQGFMVALTGSKFITGPTFSGVLLIPGALSLRLRALPFPPSLATYSSRADWPMDWASASALPAVANVGLMLRWEAALKELSLFRLVPEYKAARFLQKFSEAIRHRMDNDPVFDMLPVPALHRQPLIDNTSWDHIQTIFPFLLHGFDMHGRRMALTREETMRVYRHLSDDTMTDNGMLIQLGQPVACGYRNEVPVSALRLCTSARVVVEAVGGPDDCTDLVIQRALAVLDKTALTTMQMMQR